MNSVLSYLGHCQLIPWKADYSEFCCSRVKKSNPNYSWNIRTSKFRPIFFYYRSFLMYIGRSVIQGINWQWPYFLNISCCSMCVWLNPNKQINTFKLHVFKTCWLHARYYVGQKHCLANSIWNIRSRLLQLNTQKPQKTDEEKKTVGMKLSWLIWQKPGSLCH